MLTSFNSTVPDARAPGVTSCIRFKQRMKVLLPQPEGPIIAVTCRGAISIAMLASAWRSPYQAFRSRMTTLGPCDGGGGGGGTSGGVWTDCCIAITDDLH